MHDFTVLHASLQNQEVLLPLAPACVCLALTSATLLSWAEAAAALRLPHGATLKCRGPHMERAALQEQAGPLGWEEGG